MTEEGIRECDDCGKQTDAGAWPDWVDGKCESCDPRILLEPENRDSIDSSLADDIADFQPWLIQRLCKPFGTPDGMREKVLNSMAFGGGLKNGGLSEDAMELLAPVFRFDYMGSSEFEWGAVPKALLRLAKNIDKYRTGSLKVQDKTIWVVHTEAQALPLSIAIYRWALEPFGKQTPSLKELTFLHHHFDDSMTYEPRADGWLGVDEHRDPYAFFIDRAMAEGFCKIFDLKLQ